MSDILDPKHPKWGEYLEPAAPALGDDALRRDLRDTKRMLSAAVLSNGGTLHVRHDAMLQSERLILNRVDTIDGCVFTVQKEERWPPKEIADAAEKVSRWYAERNIRQWALCGCQSRYV